MNNKHIPALTGVRAIAAFIVVLHHLLGSTFNNEYINAILRELNVGVNIFFVLSGFLIWHRYSVNTSLNGQWIKTYVINRIARIYPVYFIWTTIVIFLTFLASNESIKEFIFTYLLNITLLKGFSSEYVYTGISQGWTLSVEELFYLSAPLLFILNIQRKIPLIILGSFIAILGVGLFLIFRNLDFYGFFNNWQAIKITTYFGRFMEFFAGIYLAKYIRKNNLNSYQKPIFTTVGAILLIISITFILPALQSTTQHYSIQTNTGFFSTFLFFRFL